MMKLILYEFPFIPFLLATGLAVHGLRKRSLSPSGALAAFVVGFTMMSVPLRVFGISLIVFYIAGSIATKRGKQVKVTLEEGHQEAGYRSASQVLCNSLSALTAAFLWDGMLNANSLSGFILFGLMQAQTPYDFAAWCPMLPPEGGRWSRILLFFTLGHFACCLGDTLASELGILSRSKPILITTWKPVPPGTNGGMSLFGTIWSLVGGFVMGLTMALSLLWQSPACRDSWAEVLVPSVLYGMLGGGFGSLLDSLLGATVQRTRLSERTKKILTDESGKPLQGDDVKVLSGRNILSNNQVNLLSSILTALVMGKLA